MRRVTRFLIAGNLLLGAVFFGACETVPQGIQQARLEMSQTIAAEPAGDYFIGRSYY
jgi:starvation-inducible outer membrane lipoprotein